MDKALTVIGAFHILCSDVWNPIVFLSSYRHGTTQMFKIERTVCFDFEQAKDHEVGYHQPKHDEETHEFAADTVCHCDLLNLNITISNENLN